MITFTLLNVGFTGKQTNFPPCREGRNFLLFLLFALWSTGVAGQVNISGKEGLVYTPSAGWVEDGNFSAGWAFNPRRYSFRRHGTHSEQIFFVNVALLPRLEVNLNLTRSNGVGKVSGIGDRQLDVRYLAVKESKYRPSVAVLLSAPFGINNSFSSNALVAAKTLHAGKPFEWIVSLGYGSPYYVLRDESEKSNSNIFSNMKLRKKKELVYPYLSGLFAGIHMHYKKKGGILAEWDTQQVNLGLYYKLFKSWTIQGGVLNFNRFTVGTSCSFSLKRLPARLDPDSEPPL